MERVVSYPSPSQHRRRVYSNSGDTLPLPGSIHGRYVGRGGVVLFQVEENIEETRDDHQMPSQRVETGTIWKPTHSIRTGQAFSRSFRQVPRNERRSNSPSRHHVHRHWHPNHRWYTGRCNYPILTYSSLEHPASSIGGMVPITSNGVETRRREHRVPSYGHLNNDSGYRVVAAVTQDGGNTLERRMVQDHGRCHSTSRDHTEAKRTSIVVIPNRIVIPREMTAGPEILTKNTEPTAISPKPELPARQHSIDSNGGEVSPRLAKRAKTSENDRLEGKFDKLDLLCSATLELGPLQDNPTGCSCPKSKCIALYCDCFKAGRRCNLKTCTCLNCKNTVTESGPDGARSKVCMNARIHNYKVIRCHLTTPISNVFLWM